MRFLVAGNLHFLEGESTRKGSISYGGGRGKKIK